MPIRKTVPLSTLAETILPHLLQSLKQRESTTETQALTEAVTKGLITMLPRAWASGEHQYGGLPLEQLLEELRHLLSPILVFMAEHDALKALLKPYSVGISDSIESYGDELEQQDREEDIIHQNIISAMSDMDDLGFSMSFDDDDD